MENILTKYALEYNNKKYFEKDPIIFPTHFAQLYKEGKASLQDVEIAGILAAHLAWGRRDMIVRDCNRLFEEMKWQPLEYVINGNYKCDDCSLHRTIKWSEFATICANLKAFYKNRDSNFSLESLTPDRIRTEIFSQKSNPGAANKKIHMFRRWMVRNDGIVDLGLWKNISPAELIIPLDVHVHRIAKEMGITSRNSSDLSTAMEITEYLKVIFPEDPCKGDFALFGYGVSRNK
ncbi:MAG: TIGR02757 family protein [Bacteroidales bacterium]|nr:TIGR02757 family protein [Bacteroidales bacterium]MDD4670143.1 TIGR02757 family protein [Bacteroidales bacterium]